MDEELINAASAARLRAYAPYSRFAVGAAVRGSSGQLFTGCNIENISFGLTICAERVCLGTAVAAGELEFDAIAIVSDSSEPVAPCGACRQSLAEFAPFLRVISVTLSGQIEEVRLNILLPNPRKGILG